VVLRWINTRNNYPDLPVRLCWYIGAISAAGPLLALSVLMTRGRAPAEDLWPVTIVLVLLAGVAERNPIHLTHKTNLNVATAVYVAMLLLLPPTIVGAIALITAGAAQTLRMRADARLALAEPLFNIGQTALYVTVTSLVLLLLDEAGMPALPYAGISLSALLVVTAAMHLGNAFLVSMAAGLHLDVNPFRIWRRNLSIDLVPNLGMSLLGVCAAALGAESALLIPALFVPAVLVHRTVEESVRLQKNMRSSLASLIDIIELRDPYTAGHSRRVATTARALALELGLTAEEADSIESAGHVHDIGKVAIDPAVLTKPGKLTEDEWVEMKRHPVFGAEVISQFAAYQEGSPLVRWHHESWDGEGYPDGKRGEEIPLGARILAVADTFDALTSDRPYREGMPLERARAILDEGAGTQWDTAVVDALLGLLDRAPHEVPISRRPVSSSATTLDESDSTAA
jgi:HD-GYP domain-containing protein (c-di-GMP phosphodiesterase class II)